MLRLLRTILVALISTMSWAQVASNTASDAAPQRSADAADDGYAHAPAGKVCLVRGVVKRVDPLHDKLLIRVFGGGNLWIALEPRTELNLQNGSKNLTDLAAGSVISIDTVIDHGKLLARSVRISSSANGEELKGQVVGYDSAKSRLDLRDALSPQILSLRITAATKVDRGGHAATPEALSPGMLVKVRFSAAQNSADEVEILAERGGSFTFEGQVVSVDLRAGILALSNETDHDVHELSIGSLDSTRLRLLREGEEVTIQAEFDGERYKVQAVTPLLRNR